MDCILKKFSLNFSKFSNKLLGKTKNVPWTTLLQKIDLCLSPKFYGNVSGSSKSENERFLSFGRKTAKVLCQSSFKLPF